MIYEITSGKLYDGPVLVGTGWAGHGVGKNNPAAQNTPGIGPLPVGNYTINDPVQGTHLGPDAFPLTPDVANIMYGRSAFYIHGANVDPAKQALSSDGCIIQGPVTRNYIAAKIQGTPKDSPYRQLQVVTVVTA